MNNKISTKCYEVVFCCEKNCASLRWSIKNFLTGTLTGKDIRSPNYNSAGGTWFLSVYPVSAKYAGKVSIYLYRISSDEFPLSENTVSYKISLQDKNGVNFYTQENQQGFGATETSWGEPALFDRYILMNEKRSELLPDDTLTIFCKINAGCTLSHSQTAEATQESGDLSVQDLTDKCCMYELLKDFKTIFESQKYCDVVLISSDNQQFPSHKAILEGRSTVFAAMFRHDMKENRSGEVHIEDVHGSILKEVLHYIYTGKVDEISACDILQLFTAADKYDLVTLKEQCVQYIVKNMSVENVCDALILADRFKERKLQDSAMSFLSQDVAKVIETSFWKEFVRQYSYLAANILASVILIKRT